MNKQDISSLASVSSFDYNLMYLIVYDITNRSSFTHIKDRFDDVPKYTDDNPSKIIIGNTII